MPCQREGLNDRKALQMNTMQINGVTLTITDFTPRTFKATDCLCEDKTVVTKAGRIEYTKCDNCGQEVWS